MIDLEGESILSNQERVDRNCCKCLHFNEDGVYMNDQEICAKGVTVENDEFYNVILDMPLLVLDCLFYEVTSIERIE